MYNLTKDLSKYSHKNISDIASKRVIVRSVLNVSVDSEGRMTDDTRYQEALPLITELAGNTKSLVITAHLGRPELREKKSSLWHVAETLQKDLSAHNPNIKFEFIEDLTDESISRIQNESNGTVFLLENVRFFKGEESKDLQERMEFAKILASLADVFINNAFADYRESASTYDIATLLPSFIGPAFLSEVSSLGAFSAPARPFVAVLGGAKLSEKLDALKSLAEVADHVLIGGAMAYTLLKAKGINVGKSLVEDDKLEVAKEINEKFGNKILLPVDHMVVDSFSETAAHEFTQDEVIPEGKIAIDIGPKTINAYKLALEGAKSILWNGPMGVFEWQHSAKGTEEVGAGISANTEAFALAGGGDSIAAINKLGLTGFDHISTGGGAMLAFLAYEKFGTLDVILR